MLNQLQKANPHIEIRSTADPSFLRYAMPMEAEPLADLFGLLREKTDIPVKGNVYVASSPELEGCRGFALLQQNYYGGMPIQAGYCNGSSGALNALEYHRGIEVTLAATPLVLLLAHYNDIRGGRLDSSAVNAYYIAPGEAFALYGSTLHYAPCAVLPGGFKAGVILPRETNTPYQPENAPVFGQDQLIYARNKWLIAHPDSVPAREKGAYAGITGENIAIHTVIA